MHLPPFLVFFAYAHICVTSPLAEPHPDTSANGERDVDSSLKEQLIERDSTVYNALGTFGPSGLLGSVSTAGDPVSSNGNNPGGDDTYVAPYICFTHCGGQAIVYLAYVAALGIEEGIAWIKRLFSFHNNDPVNWPTPTDGSVLWSVRTFRNTDCGQPGVRQGIDPLESDSTGPYMMSEYKFTDFNYHDNQPCENFMLKNPSEISGIGVQSVAVWLAESVQDALIFLYTSPTCDASVSNGATTTQFTSLESNLVSIYNGTGALFEGDDTASQVGPGVWACVNAAQATWNAFSVVQVGTTDMTIPNNYYVNGHIPASATVPKTRADVSVSRYGSWTASSIEDVGPAPYNELADPNYYANSETLGYKD